MESCLGEVTTVTIGEFVHKNLTKTHLQNIHGL